MPTSTAVRCVAQTADRLGEGPLWSAAEGRLYWFDIKAPRLRWLEPARGTLGACDLPFRASAAARRTAGGLLVATERGLIHLNPDTGALAIVHPITPPEGFRSNEGKIDVHGRFWWSLMDDDHGRRPGSIFRTDPDGATQEMISGVHIANTLTSTADGRHLYWADSRLQTLYRDDLEAPGGRTEFASLKGQDAGPDGGAMDAEGFLWNAHWGAGRVVRYAPDGAIERTIQVPVTQPSSCAFGGPDLATLYITSAWDGLSDQARAAQPLAGGLFACEPGVKGLALPEFAG